MVKPYAAGDLVDVYADPDNLRQAVLRPGIHWLNYRGGTITLMLCQRKRMDGGQPYVLDYDHGQTPEAIPAYIDAPI
jgi:hypothetical protein